MGFSLHRSALRGGCSGRNVYPGSILSFSSQRSQMDEKTGVKKQANPCPKEQACHPVMDETP